MRLLRRRERTEAPAEEQAGHATTATAPEGPAASRATAPEGPQASRVQAPAQAAPAQGPAAPAQGERVQGAESGRPPVARRRRGFRGRTRDAGAATAGALGSAVVAVARLVMTIAVLIALLIGLAIVLVLVDANTSNTIVKGIHEGANFFAGAFTGLITFPGHPKREILVDWGIAMLVYLFVGAVLSRIIARIGYGGLRFERRHRTVSAH